MKNYLIHGKISKKITGMKGELEHFNTTVRGRDYTAILSPDQMKAIEYRYQVDFNLYE